MRSIREFGFKIPVWRAATAKSWTGICGSRPHASWRLREIPVILCDEWSAAQVKAFRLMVNRSVTWADWDEELLALELQDLQLDGLDLSLDRFRPDEIDDFLSIPNEQGQEAAPPLPENSGIPCLAICGCAAAAGNRTACSAETRPVRRQCRPVPGRIEAAVDGHRSALRYRTGFRMAGPGRTERPRACRAQLSESRTKGHQETTISGDTRADWSEAFALVPSLEVAYVWHASKFTREVLDGLLRIGFLHHQQIIWNKGACRAHADASTGLPMNPVGTSARRTHPGTVSRVRTRPSGTRPRRSSSWGDRMRKSSITPPRSRSN